VIVSKNIPVKNIYYMLSYAFSALKNDKYINMETEKFDNIYDLFSEIIAKATNLLIKRGLGRDYISLNEITTSPHGKIDVSCSIKSNLIVQHKLNCEYDDYLSDIYMNQIIKTTISLLIKQDIDSKIKKDLKIILMYFKDVRLINIHDINWKFRYNRNNKHYELLLSMCYLVIKGMIQTNEEGQTKLMNFLDDQRLCHLYEKFILEFYKKECSWLKASSSKIDWILDDDYDDSLPNMQSDIMLEYKDKILIIDAKFYTKNMQQRFDKKTIVSGNLYQIFTYVKNKQFEDESKTVFGMLLYAKTEDEIQPDNTYLMSGNSISVKTLDLNRDFSLIKEELISIANEIR